MLEQYMDMTLTTSYTIKILIILKPEHTQNSLDDN